MNRTSRSIESVGAIERFAAGSVLFREGERGDRAYIIEAGIVEISTSLQDERFVLKRLGPGEIFGEMAIIDDAARSATATVVSDSALRVIHRLQLQERLRQADPILDMLIRLITKRYRCSVGTLKEGTTAQKVGDDAEPKEVSGKAVDKFRMEVELSSAVKNRCLMVQYQPVVDLFSGRVIAFEALARWKHAHDGFVPPQVFVPLAEETDLIRAVDEFVFKKAVDCIHLINLCNREDVDALIAINVSPRELKDLDYLDMARGVVQRKGLEPNLVQLEITESQIAENGNAEAWIKAAHSYGFRVALDDFGTGFSSLAQLHRLEVDTVKIDRSFINKLGQIERNGAMMRSIIVLAKSMNLTVIAEGIETECQKSLLSQLDCPFGQGFFLGKPMPIEEILADNSVTFT